jgi:SAM-dependent methyltransferase
MTPAALFSWMTRRGFYSDLHDEAAAMIPVPPSLSQPGPAPSWIDVGSGPGLITRMAASLGYDATGIDSSSAICRALARRQAAREDSTAQFQRGDVGDLPAAAAQVVSALSLLAVLANPTVGVAATARAGRCFDPTAFGVEPGVAEHRTLLGGPVSAWWFAKVG